ncbi:hypothetical protein L3X38_016156 [Prunus dulcis]|uniref:Uncharacterized protein n=1 Tax=Prunus dulcis TaxID=3755 RepID=A0AAD4W7G0_PRUDU|nr:hypothetical protein L3X38_016156 [Prunus dulcis]
MATMRKCPYCSGRRWSAPPSRFGLRHEPIYAFLSGWLGSRGTNSTSSLGFQPFSGESSRWIPSSRSFPFGFRCEPIYASLSGWSRSKDTNSTSSSSFQPFQGSLPGGFPHLDLGSLIAIGRCDDFNLANPWLAQDSVVEGDPIDDHDGLRANHQGLLVLVNFLLNFQGPIPLVVLLMRQMRRLSL